MSNFKTCDQLVEHFDENTKHLIDSDTYDLIRITWEAASAAMGDENKCIKSERDAFQSQVVNLEKIAKRLIFDFEHYENGEPHIDDIHNIVADARKLIEKAEVDDEH
ncbi:hypothetical protein MIH18_23510 (plasmid) [Marinobacter sp. M3C]|jgi:ABC-type transporter Mla subunit MlaD|uniref:hypothetical protein n=1 Tax=Marinobacter sp. M3C TaxID=2917715 RepID=UPI00201064CE|nr:hypothetical protein [Marinobacter sp. M3C]MCL1485175.1 hypothetical protein [Marinobacter sp.]UQG62800.1 hypothetical protein MIH18_23510 [Marinobacter sp. M3C]